MLVDLSGPISVMGRSMVLYEREDDNDQTEHPPAENREARFKEGMGRRIACCVIGLVKGETPEPKYVAPVVDYKPEPQYVAPVVDYKPEPQYVAPAFDYKTEPVLEYKPEPQQYNREPVQSYKREPVQSYKREPVQSYKPEPVQQYKPARQERKSAGISKGTRMSKPVRPDFKKYTPSNNKVAYGSYDGFGYQGKW